MSGTADPLRCRHAARLRILRALRRRGGDERLLAWRDGDAWHPLAAEDINRYGLTTLVGEPDPAMQIDITLWRDDLGISRLVPFPDDWAPPHSIAHRALDPERHGIREYTRDDIFHSDVAGF